MRKSDAPWNRFARQFACSYAFSSRRSGDALWPSQARLAGWLIHGTRAVDVELHGDQRKPVVLKNHQVDAVRKNGFDRTRQLHLQDVFRKQERDSAARPCWWGSTCRGRPRPGSSRSPPRRPPEGLALRLALKNLKLMLFLIEIPLRPRRAIPLHN